MKYRMNIIVVAVLLILAGLVWNMTRNQNLPAKPIAAVPLSSVSTPQRPKIEVVIVPARQPVTPAIPALQPTTTDKVVHVADDAATTHIAQRGETVTSLANDLLGKDTKTNRDAIINANSSLKADPDKLLVGSTYRIPSPAEVRDAKSAPAIATPAIPTPAPVVKEATPPAPTTELKYTAEPGDTVTKMAKAFLGSDAQTHQDAIVNANASLKSDPDHVVAGKAYSIPAPNGLSAAPASAQASPRPTTQPDADQVLLASSPRTLRYTARAGDTVTTLAIELLGSDTQETRNAIINNNAALKRDPDRVIAGQTYWIPAPAPAIANPR
ncbi:MAG TPA: LysM peptidoglycan-binding domain-containing protein [Humisphaera sp.]|nr:LysM peptidoglycan-binding domain-containing protein [Humisphaera sp.]